MTLKRLTVILLCYIQWLSASIAEAAEAPLDTSGVTAVVITGTASSVTLGTAAAKPYQASLTNRRSGWFARWYSSWFFADCPMNASMRVDGATLYVDVPPAGFLDRSDCVTEIRANLQREVAVTINQAATDVHLSGDYAAVTLIAQAADLSLDGHATMINVSGEALRTRFIFQTVRQTETVNIKAKELDTYLGFGADTKIDYAVMAKASWVDSSLANTPDAKPKVTIKGDFVRATIR
jgi:hypothetical protein